MKKVLIAALALVMGASLSLAGMGLNWTSGSGWLVAYGETVDGEGVLVNNNVIWQLIYAGADGQINKPTIDEVKAGAPYLAGDDEQLAVREISAAGAGGTSMAGDDTTWDEWLMLSDGYTVYQDLGWTTEGYVYQRIWQGTPDASSDSYFYDSPLAAIDTSFTGGLATPQSLYYDPRAEGVVVDNVIPGETPPGPTPPTPGVPEPATMSLLGLGALAMVLRRKLSK